ncbi:MAG: hypothetical protein AB7C89_05210 [Intestinibacillus sp.]
MHEISGENDLRLTCADAKDGVIILRCETRDANVRLPDEIGGQPVTALGEYALSARAPDLRGLDTFSVRVTCGGPEPVHDARAILQVSLPRGLRRVGRYAFYDCRSLAALSLTDAVTEFSGGALVNCVSLRAVRLALREGASTCLQKLLGEHAGETEVHLDFGTQQALLLFPAYSEDMEELPAPHIFRRHIEGAGYAYRQCFDGGILSFHQYDSMFSRLLEMHAFEPATRVACCRLRLPYALSAAARDQYLACLRTHGMPLACDLAARGEAQTLAFLLSLGVLDPAAVGAACNTARQHRRTEALGLLLNGTSGQTGAARAKTFDL